MIYRFCVCCVCCVYLNSVCCTCGECDRWCVCSKNVMYILLFVAFIWHVLEGICVGVGVYLWYMVV